MRPGIRRLVVILLVVLCAWSVPAPDLFADDFFDQNVAPILVRHCLGCHSGDRPEGGFSLHSLHDAVENDIVVPGDVAASRLFQLVEAREGTAAMPQNSAPLSNDQVNVLREWIANGATWPADIQLEPNRVGEYDWWAFKPLTKPTVPSVDDVWAESPIDKFILSKLNQQALSHSPAADRRTLIRRLTYDLTGLPPSFHEVEAFVQDPRADAYEILVDELLASPSYGERWARHWLDVVKYADTHGYDKDKLRPNAWPYRDYVIHSLNQDKPYWRFVQEQIAGDVLFPNEPDGILGLGFIAAGPWDFIGHAEVPESKIDGKVARNLDRDDMIANVFNTFCSLTVQCARCHDHKFDPITQQQYYGLQSLLAAVDRADRQYDIDPRVERQRQELKKELASLRSELKVSEVGSGIDSGNTVSTVQQEIQRVQAELSELPPQKLVYAAATHFSPQSNFRPTEGKLRPIHVLQRGDVAQPGEIALPCVLPFSPDAASSLDPDSSEGQRRSALALWLTSTENPLVWRSIVNRVWQYHFGRGLVDSPNDFGRMGDQPSNSLLLDWLAAEFRDGGQSLKKLHRMIVTSNTYRQASVSNLANETIDKSNRYFWRAERRRLDAEQIRDSMLKISGTLDTAMGGPGFYLFELEKTEHSPHYEYHKFNPGDHASAHRRSIYRFVVRSQPDPWLSTLDCADSSQSTAKRSETLTALQALSLLNNRFSLYMAECFSRRLKIGPTDLERQVTSAFQSTFQRMPDQAEIDELTSYAHTHGLTNLCRLMFNFSEFMYID
ncbi:MAG: DUF1553 domain-containing protein [Planctomycetales bacterium]|nr:DUF1553 domain-containing protein [Planctomycetales bacterium]